MINGGLSIMSELKKTTMVKKVNIFARIPIRTVTPNLYGKHEGLMMSPGNILKCIIHKAVVDEVLNDGSTIRLTMKNYNLDNNALLGAKTEPKLANTVRSAIDENDPATSTTRIEKNNPEEVKNEEETDKGTDMSVTEPNTKPVEEPEKEETPVETVNEAPVEETVEEHTEETEVQETVTGSEKTEEVKEAPVEESIATEETKEVQETKPETKSTKSSGKKKHHK